MYDNIVAQKTILLTCYFQEYTDNVVALWNDNGIRECYRRSNEFQLIDSAK